jgi:hypothetical protein
MKPIRAFSAGARFIVLLLRCIFFLVHLARGKKWSRPRKNFKEDPMHYSLLDGIYFGYKYYFKPHEQGVQELRFSGSNPNQYRNEDPDTRVTITAAGDLMPYEWISEKFCKDLWNDVGEDFFASDIVMANLETPIDPSQPIGLVPEVMLNHMEFNGNEEMFNVFNGNEKYKGYDVVSTANNHAFDKGEQGIINTINFLQKKNIHYCGTAASWALRDHFPILERKGIRIAFIAYTYSLNHLQLPLGKEHLCNHIPLNTPGCDLSFVRSQARLAKERGADIIIASVHYGNAYQLFPGDHIVTNTHRLFDECGIDIILGSHAHNIQPLAYYGFTCPHTGKKKTGFVTYCMGDFVAYDIFTWGHLPVWLKIEIAKSGGDTFIHDVTINPLYTSGVYKSKNDRDLRFYDAIRLWERIERGEPIDLPEVNRKEAMYLKTIYEKVFPIDTN